jgi:hypothetical protein
MHQYFNPNNGRRARAMVAAMEPAVMSCRKNTLDSLNFFKVKPYVGQSGVLCRIVRSRILIVGNTATVNLGRRRATASQNLLAIRAGYF